MAPKNPKASEQLEKAPEPPRDYPTIAAQLDAEYLASRPFQVLRDENGFASLSPRERSAYATAVLLETGTWHAWAAPQQKEFWQTVERLQIPIPVPRPRGLGKDPRGVALGEYTPSEYGLYARRERELRGLRAKSESFRRTRASEQGASEEAVEEERNRRKLLGHLQGRKMGVYESDPKWDDVVPLAQDDGEGALAAIAYTDEYAEGNNGLPPRPHYTVWLYRASTLFALASPLEEELDWLNQVALDNQKNYQIWHHRQLLIDHLYTRIASDAAAIARLADSEVSFMSQMFHEDAKNYHVWSYRQYLVRKLDLFNEKELESTHDLLRTDVRNNSAWSHRFFVVFSDPKICTPGCPATQPDPRIPDEIIERELEVAKAATYDTPQNQSPWNYLRGVLRKGGRSLASQERFAETFVRLPAAGGEGDEAEAEEEYVRSSHALDLLADVWGEMGEVAKADRVLVLLGDKYDRIRKNYWDWRRSLLRTGREEVRGER
ncbi:protein farnesyltransferase/geranylgeranyltransferase type I alpha subunit [Drepanopeziza brunnea f. sp. 'multigermtubi' MB_m1]|uniref:Protein farnesyltransferase/geranylgeranyltransferase type-1 subunit alpha n=1 Tax=Marssonina brunnea f. sp. multigermtubi (strain MB_m1) TaxID=1072389 RepID=K1WA44_MARBU|nr:protein farnesyltransferase/geranylgeranyltransferase type I alpha subunit [Drepanopeziza brunnea f. sp. 'multigermtubi' MB_m1]EKD14130.1 protein farnesyltransferase/geranylgeranyltransferase type I alpha subunit [Drepanopeziza brunnea f. sp. 'multigermtubi' MB_m1]